MKFTSLLSLSIPEAWLRVYSSFALETSEQTSSMSLLVALPHTKFLYLNQISGARMSAADDQPIINLFKFEQKVLIYCGAQIESYVKENIQAIRKWIEEQKLLSEKNAKTALIAGIVNVVQTSISSMDYILSSNTPDRIKGALNITASVACLVGGGYGLAAAAICSILGYVLSAAYPGGSDLATGFAKMVGAEISNFHKKLQFEQLSGLEHRVSHMNRNLDKLRNGKTRDIPDKALYETDFPQFLGAICSNIVQNITQESNKEEVQDCVRCILMYCMAETSFLLLLSNVLATLEVAGEPTLSIKTMYEAEISKSKEILGFLSDDRSLSSFSYLPTEAGKVFKVIALRGNIPLYTTVDEFREGIGLTRMPDVEVVLEKATAARSKDIKTITGSYPVPHRNGDNHYFQLINHTDFPVKVICGTAGSEHNGLNLCNDIQPHSSFERIATRKSWTFSTAGYFIIYFDGILKSDERRFNGDVKVFEFALSNPLIGTRKANILDKSNDIYSVSGADCWDAMTGDSHDGKNIFQHGNKFFRVYVTFDCRSNRPARNGCRTWQFVIQQFEPHEDMETSMAK